MYRMSGRTEHFLSGVYLSEYFSTEVHKKCLHCTFWAYKAIVQSYLILVTSISIFFRLRGIGDDDDIDDDDDDIDDDDDVQCSDGVDDEVHQQI